jgi:hypothetical protein
LTCRVPPSWLELTYGYSPQVWSRAVDQARGTLIEWARRERIDTYTELMNHVAALDWDEEQGPLHSLREPNREPVWHVSTREWLQHRPLLSALVVYAGEGGPTSEPTRGFFDFAAQLGYEVGDKAEECDAFWSHEVRACFGDWHDQR